MTTVRRASHLPHDQVSRAWPTVAVLIAALVVVATASWYAGATLTDLSSLTDKRAMARAGRLYLEQTLSLFKDLETGVRGFVITGQDQYLEPYRNAQSALPEVYSRLKNVLGEDLPDGISWVELDALTQQRLDLLARTIVGKRNRGDAILRDTALFSTGKATMDRLRERFRDIDDYQDKRIADIDVLARETRRRAERWSSIALVSAAGFILLAIYLLLRERRIRLSFETQLRQLNADLDAKVAERSAELVKARDQLAEFALQQDRAIEAERRRLSREVHDQIGQVFTAVKLIARSLPPEAFPPDQEAALGEALETGIAVTRRITAELRPPLLDDLGLEAAIDHYVGQISTRANLACEVELKDQQLLDAAQSLTMFRIVQEAMTNVLRHAEARRVAIEGRADSSGYVLTISDDGRGLATEPLRPGALGLAGMAERAKLVGGECRISTRREGGTVVEVRLPRSREPMPDEDSAR